MERLITSPRAEFRKPTRSAKHIGLAFLAVFTGITGIFAYKSYEGGASLIPTSITGTKISSDMSPLVKAGIYVSQIGDEINQCKYLKDMKVVGPILSNFGISHSLATQCIQSENDPVGAENNYQSSRALLINCPGILNSDYMLALGGDLHTDVSQKYLRQSRYTTAGSDWFYSENKVIQGVEDLIQDKAC